MEEKILKSTGAAGIIIKGEGVQIIYEPNVNIVKTNLEDYLPDVPDELLWQILFLFVCLFKKKVII